MTLNPSICLKDANLLDVRKGELVGLCNIFVEAGMIVDVSGRDPETAQLVIDVKGKTVMPGLCDAHVHVVAATASFPDLERWAGSYTTARAGQILSGMLSRGFTTVRDCGGADFGIAQAVDEGFLIGPRVLFCGHAISQTGGHGDMRGKADDWEACTCCHGLGTIVDGVPEVRRACRNELRKGAHFIKIMASGGVSSPTDRISNTQFALDEITAAVEEAEATETYVAAHVYTARAAKRVLKCGVRSIEHGNLIDDEVMDLMIEKGAFLVPTMSTHEVLKSEGLEGGLTVEMHEKVDEVVEAGYRTHKRAHEKGVKLVFGTDLLGAMHRHQLLEFSIRSKFQTPIEIIRSATLTAAELFNMVGRVGEIVPGAYADLIVIDGDPVIDIKYLQDPDRYLKLIMKDGKIYKNAI
ncbi:amidohydrolase family protein [Sneathiella sp. P13V-1]|uniref:metal-dependent hydrolase family protein n=1 Tax=Sneathiella sp. P13V-1 TaxID=2697366 RepID=UPI00187B344B|nr:amidohydrolase family protein [Sneathiella sp. P13V-1]MBE7638390.1 amidohydrolase family protein [Sneathiella sp. P13V-1]